MQPFQMLLVLFGVLCLVALVYLLRWERGYFTQRGKLDAWLPVRLATVPIAVVTAMAVVLPARTASGMEGLAAFYILLLAVAPMFWFGAHWVAGRFVKPPLVLGESALIAGSPIALVIVLSAVAHKLQPIAWSLLRTGP